MSGANAPAGPRPTDPKRFQSVDMYAKNTEGDIEYQRMVKDIEEMQQRQGWLAGSGAFDKADLLYLRDTAEQQRHVEMEQHDTEVAEFAAARARVEREEQLESLLPLKSAGSGGGLSKPPFNKPTKPLVAPRVKVKASSQRSESNASSGSNSSQPTAKKPRTEGAAEAPAESAATPAPAAAAGAPAAGTGAGGSAGARATAGTGSSSKPAPAAAPAAIRPASEEQEGDDAAAGLGGLLGGYGSASDSDAEPEQQQQQQRGAGAGDAKKVQLPSAEDALAGARPWDPDAEKEPEEPRRRFGLLGAQDDTELLDWGDGPVQEEQAAAAAVAAGQGHDRAKRWV